MLRHKGFKNQSELANFVKEVIPSDVYYSCAYYSDPIADMAKKGWLGADLIFDIDADHISTSCNKVHDEWTCGSCGFVGKGITPNYCPVCHSQKFKIKSWPCEVCLECAKEETVKLIDMLRQDFGFSEHEIRIFFSGHRGYHVHVECEEVKSLDSVARKDIVNYVSGLGVSLFLHGLNMKNPRWSQIFSNKSLMNFGWHARLVRNMQSLISSADEKVFKDIGLNKSVIANIFKNKDLILKGLSSLGTLGIVKGIGFGSWRKIAEYCAKLQYAQVDTVVTTDVHRLIRLAGTLHGKTGFKKVEFSASEIENFDPFRSAIAFRTGTARVFVLDAPEFRLDDETFGPYKNQHLELPTAAAVLLICKERAEVLE
ncbi:MAG: DNA primase small subunit domain-containing protein [Candidatus Bathyarchaeia archaeon]